MPPWYHIVAQIVLGLLGGVLIGAIVIFAVLLLGELIDLFRGGDDEAHIPEHRRRG